MKAWRDVGIIVKRSLVTGFKKMALPGLYQSEIRREDNGNVNPPNSQQTNDSGVKSGRNGDENVTIEDFFLEKEEAEMVTGEEKMPLPSKAGLGICPPGQHNREDTLNTPYEVLEDSFELGILYKNGEIHYWYPGSKPVKRWVGVNGK